MTLVFMGVSGCGKTTLGKLVAEETGARFVEGDEFHPPENVEKMRSGEPLNDDDREGWLKALAAEISAALDGPHLCVSCSALKRKYRDLLREGDPQALFVVMHGDRAILDNRVTNRSHEYMPASLLDSQLATLEIPVKPERFLHVDIAESPTGQLQRVLKHLQAVA
ncbi:MAG: gluconokinase [Verrucomicrobiota bacterium]